MKYRGMRVSSNFKVAIAAICAATILVLGICIYASQLINAARLSEQISYYQQGLQAQIMVIREKISGLEAKLQPGPAAISTSSVSSTEGAETANKSK